MLKACAKLGDYLGKSLFIVGGLCTKSTDFARYLTSQVSPMHLFNTAFEQPAYSNPQPKTAIFKVIRATLSPFYTSPIATNKLIKDLYS